MVHAGEDDFDDELAGLDDENQIPAQPVAAVNAQGRPSVARAEGAGTYRGWIFAAMERPLKSFLSRFVNVVGGRASADGTIPTDEQAPDDKAQRALLDEMGRIWVRLSNDVINAVSERFAIVGEDARFAPLDRLGVASPSARTLLVAKALTISGSAVTNPYSFVTTTPVWVERGDLVTVQLLYTPASSHQGRPIIYPQFGMNGHVYGLLEFDFVTLYDGGTIVAGPGDGAELDGKGRMSFKCFDADVVAPATRSETVLDGLACSATGWLRFALVDVGANAGAVTMIVKVS